MVSTLLENFEGEKNTKLRNTKFYLCMVDKLSGNWNTTGEQVRIESDFIQFA